MRTLGVAILGLFVGLIVGFLILSEAVGRLVVDNGSVATPWGMVIGFGPQVIAVVGAVAAVVIDKRYLGGQSRAKGDGES